ncbi:MAG: hypothetical protein KF754_16360 [Planctomycetes bacterium]|nr:hypothetical protein [Planctomycetota bacterium]
MHASEHNLLLSNSQVLAWIRQCSTQEKKVFLKDPALSGQGLLDDTAALTIASEPS